MINIKIWKKKINSFFISKYFFTLLLSSIVFYIIFTAYGYIKIKQNKTAFSSLYTLLERYQGAINTTSVIPLEEIIKEIDVEYNKLGFFCTISDQFILLKASILLLLKKTDDALTLLHKTVTADSSNELNFLYQLLIAITYATNENMDKKQEGIALLKKYTTVKKFQDVAIFYYGYFLLKTTSLKQADEAWAPLKYDPQFNNSPYKNLVEQARNCEY
jgi:hypothetical protein